MSKAIAPRASGASMATIEQVLITGDLARLTEEQRVKYYLDVCHTLGLNPTTKPFDYITLNGKLVLYANKGCAEQLRQIHKISIRIMARETIGDVYVVTAQAEGKGGRVDESTGAVTIKGLGGDFLANAYLKCETKAKRRVTLSICGLNMLDESEVGTIPATAPFQGAPRSTPPAQTFKDFKDAPPAPRDPKVIRNEINVAASKLSLTSTEISDWVRDEFEKDKIELTPAEMEEFLVILQREVGLAGVPA